QDVKALVEPAVGGGEEDALAPDGRRAHSGAEERHFPADVFGRGPALGQVLLGAGAVARWPPPARPLRGRRRNHHKDPKSTKKTDKKRGTTNHTNHTNKDKEEPSGNRAGRGGRCGICLHLSFSFIRVNRVIRGGSLTSLLSGWFRVQSPCPCRPP